MLQTILNWVRFSFTLPISLLSWFAVILLCVIQFVEFKKLSFNSSKITLHSEWKPWFAKVYKFSVTLGRAIIRHPDHSLEVLEHEEIHSHQLEDFMFLSFLMGLVVSLISGDPLLGFAVWTSGGLWVFGLFVTGFLRHCHAVTWPKEGSTKEKLKNFASQLFNAAYLGSQNERSAYAQTDKVCEGKSWLDISGLDH